MTFDALLDRIAARDRGVVNGFRRYLAISGPAPDPSLPVTDARGVRHPDRLIHLPWPWMEYACGNTGPPPRLWWLDDPTDHWTGGDQA